MQTAQADIELLGALKQGDETAFDRVYGMYYKPLCFFAERFVSNPTTAEDIVTESFIKLIQRSPEFETIRHLKSYLYTSTRNACIDELRMQKRQQRVRNRIEQSEVISEEEAGHNLIMAEVLHSIYRAIDELPDKYKEIVRMSLIDGLSNSEIAIKKGMADQTIRNHKSEGIKLLRISLLQSHTISTFILYCALTYLRERNF